MYETKVTDYIQRLNDENEKLKDALMKLGEYNKKIEKDNSLCHRELFKYEKGIYAHNPTTKTSIYTPKKKLKELLNINRNIILTEIKSDSSYPVKYVKIAVPNKYEELFVQMMDLIDKKIDINKEEEEFKKELKELIGDSLLC